MSSQNKLKCDLERAPSLSGDSKRDNTELFPSDHMLGDAAISLEVHETLVTSENVSKTVPQCTGELETDSVSTNDIDANKNGVNTNRCELNTSSNSVKYREDYTCSTATKILSFASPEGVPMDPLAPAALAVSSELMGHIGTGLTMLREHSKKVQKYVLKNNRLDLIRKPWKSVVNIVLVEAENLPDGPDAGSNSLYCKFKLGTETHKSKRVPKLKSIWRERFNLLQNDETNLEVTVWQKYKQKNFMGRCVIDLSLLEKERTHDLWRELECGYGRLHLVITLSDRAVAVADNVLTSSVRHALPVVDRYTWYRLDNDWSEVGQLCVTVHGARGLTGSGLSGRTDAYCVLELDNNRVQTHTARCTSQPHWGKSFKFAITDITSTLDIGVYNETLFSPIKGEMIGKISIPLLRINEHEKRWFALKNRSKKSSARGNCPRILLEISVVWNPIKASLRLMSPKETKYVQKPPKFDIPLIYSNLNFIKDIFHAIYLFNEHIKQVFEWNNRDKSTLALFAWVAFWYVFKFWMAPLLLLAPFIYNWIKYKNMNHHSTSITVYQSDDEIDEEVETNKQDVKTIKNRLYDLQDLTLTIKNGIDFLVSTIERINNLTNFTVPYLSYLVMIILVAASVVLYVIPVNYLFMALGIYKYTRKYLNPERRPNNDILDFLSRVPNNEILKEWRELKVPEPNQNRLDDNL